MPFRSVPPLVLIASLLLSPGCTSPARTDGVRSTDPRACAACALEATGRLVEWQGRRYHPSCYERVGPRCAVCDKAIVGPLVRTGTGPVYHDACFKGHPKCDSCGHPAGGVRGPLVRFQDGRVSCKPCASTAVQENGAAQDVLDEARGELARLLGVDTRDVDVPVRLVGRPELLQRAGRELADPNLKAFTQVEELLEDGKVRSRRFEILALHGLPRSALYGVLAHEAFHVAQTLAGEPSAADPALREGAANWAQWRLLVARGELSRARPLLDDDDPIYGEGFRRVKRVAEARGDPAAVELGLKGQRFPTGF